MTPSSNGWSQISNMIGVVLILLSAGSWIAVSNGQVVCGSSKLNLAFAVDGSTKMGQANFSTAITFAINVSKHLDLNANMTWIHFVYGNKTASYNDSGSLMISEAVLSSSFPNDTQLQLGETLELAKVTLFNNGSRGEGANVIVVITSVKSVDDIAVPTINLKQSNVTVFTMGVGNEYSLGQLNEVASDPDRHHVMRLNSWQDANNALSFELAKKVCQVIDRCVSSPCYNNGTCTGWEGGYNCTCSVEFFGVNCEKSKSVEFLSLGCFNDQNDTRTMHSLESENSTYLKGSYQTREKAVLKCALEAIKMGYKAFAVQDGGACYSGPYAQLNYSVYGVTGCPHGGKGGYLVNEVYLLGAKCGKMLNESLIHLSNSTIRGSSYRDSWGIPQLDGDNSWCPSGVETKRKIEIELKIRLFDSRNQIIRGSSFNDSWLLPLVDGGYSWLPSDGNTRRQLDTALQMALFDFRNQTIRSLSHDESWVIPLVDHDYSWTTSDSRRQLHIELSPSERETLLMELSVQGKKGAKDYADNYCVEFDGVHNITRNLSTCLIDLSTQSSNDITTIPFRDVLTAQYLNFAPWRPLRGNGLCIRIDVFQNDNTSTPISILRNGSYNVSFNYTSVRGNLSEPPLVNSNVSWCPADDDILRDPVLKVNLGQPFNITQVQVQGATGADEWPYKLCLRYSLNGSQYFDVTRNVTSCTLFGQGLVDGNGDRIRSYEISPPRVLRSVSFEPKYPVFKTGDGFCMRTELTGCVTTTIGGEQVTEGCYKTKRNKCCVFPFWYQGRQIYSCIKGKHNQPWCATTDNYTRDHLWDDCQGISNPCETTPCLNGGTCQGNATDWNVNCVCPDGFLGDNCEQDCDECFNRPCHKYTAAVACENTIGSYKCGCEHGYSGQNCQLDCRSNNIELGFLIDGSASVQFYGENNFQTIKDFAKNLTGLFSVSNSHTRVGVFIYSTNSTLVFPLNQYSSHNTIQQAIDTIAYPGDGTFTGQALNDSVTKLFNSSIVRANVSKILVVVTDGVSTDDVTVPSALLNDSGVTSFVVGIGKDYDRSQLTQIALGVDKHVFTTEFSFLGEIAGNVREAICRAIDKCAENPCHFGGICMHGGSSCNCTDGLQGPTCMEDVKECTNSNITCQPGTRCTETFGGYQCTCGNTTIATYGENCTKDCSKESTILFMMETSRSIGQDNIFLQVEFIISVASTLEYRNIGVIAYSTEAHFVTKQGQSSNFTEFAQTLRTFNYIMGCKTNLGKGLEKAKEESELFSSSKSGIIFVIYPIYGSSDDAAIPAAELKSRQVTIIALTLARAMQSMLPPELIKFMPIVTAQFNDHFIGQTTYEGLRNQVTASRDLICQAANPCSGVSCLPGFDCHNLYGIQGGTVCLPSITACNPDPCKNGGNCTLTSGSSYNCSCPLGILGQNCTDDYDECFNSPCQNGGTCVNTFGSYSCLCNHGYSGKNCHLDCKLSKVELGFVVDGSDSIQSNFSMINHFIKNLTRSFNVSSGQTRVGIIVYSTNSTLALKLDQYSSIREIEEAIDNITYPGGQTNTGQALNESSTSLFNSSIVRANVSKILVVITDGVSTDDITGPVVLVNSTGVTAFVVGIGNAYDRSQLTQIALGEAQHVFTASLSSLADITKSIRESICRVIDKCADNPCRFGGVCRDSGSTCSCMQGLQGLTCSEDVKECSNGSVTCQSGKACTETFGGYECTCENITTYGANCTKNCSKDTTIVFVVDASRNNGQDNVLLQVEFVISVASTLAYQNIGVIAYSTEAQFVTRPGQTSNFTEFAQTLRTFNYEMGLMTKLGKALMKAKEEPELFNSSKSAIIVAMVTQKLEDEHALPAFDLKNRSVTILGLGLGTNYRMDDLYLLATDPEPDHVFTSQFSELKNLVTVTRDRICRAANPCSSATCLPGESCANIYGINGGYNCVPAPSVCYPNRCKNRGNCTENGGGSYNCSCPSGIGGVNCTDDVFDECQSGPCKNGGSCENLLGDYKCNCTSQFTGRQCDIVCSFQKFNLVFLVDGSGSIEQQGVGNFQRTKDFINTIIQSFDVGRDATNVAVVLYSDSAQVIFPLNAYYNKSDILQAVDGMQYPTGGTKTGAGLDVVRNQVLANLGQRDNLTNIVVVVTDGQSQDDVRVPSRRLRDMNVTIVSVGVGCCYNILGLKEMATDPDNGHVFDTSFTALNTVVGSLRERICKAVDHCSSNPCANGGNCTSEPNDFICNCTAQWTGRDCWTDVDECALHITQCPDDQVCHNFPGGSSCLCTDSRYGENCSTHCNFTKIDIGFLLDSSRSINDAGKMNYQTVKDFIKAIVKSVKIDRNDTRFAVATYSDVNLFSVRFNFSSYANSTEIVDATQKIPYDASGTYTGDGLNRIRTELFSMARRGIPQILIVITDGQSQDSVTIPARTLGNSGVHIMAVGVGNAVYAELADMATDPDNQNIFTANFSSIHDLVGAIIENNCRIADPCQPQPCQNGGTCHVQADLLNFRCECTTGWRGVRCEINIDECQNSPCINDALRCRDTPGSYECNCNSNFTGRHCQIGILKNTFDVLVLFDGSSTFGHARFLETLQFAKGFLAPFDISTNQTNVAAAVYAYNTTISFNFTQHYSYASVSSAIDGVPFLNQVPVNLSVALQTVNTTILSASRENVTIVLVVFVSVTLSGDCPVCQALRDQGVKIIAVGLGDQYVYSQLVAIASHPPEDFVITFPFQHIDTREGVVSGAIAQAVDLCSKFPCRFGGRCKSTPNNFTCACPVGCLGLTCIEDVNECIEANPPNCTNGTTCINTWGSAQCICPGNRYGPACQYHVDTRLDMVFLLDASLIVTQDNFTNFLYFVRGVAESLNVSLDGTHVALVLFGDVPQLKINFHDNYNQSSLEEALDHVPYPKHLQTNMGAGLSLVASVFSSNEARSNATRVLVILTATISQDDIEVPSFNLLRNHNVTIFSIGLGAQVSSGQLKEIASDPDSNHVRSFSSGIDLPFQLATFKAMLGKALDPCSDRPCQNGVCHTFKGGYTCNCTSGFSGKNCEKADDACNPDPCHNKATCIVLPLNSHYCMCSEGWTGANCSEDKKECSMGVCKNGATCHEMEGDYSCACESGDAGKNCDRVCGEDLIDLAFMLEGSASLNQWGENNFGKIVKVTKKVVNFWNRTQSRIGLVLYSTIAELKINFTNSAVERNEALDNLPYPSAWTVTGNALKFINESLLIDSRSNVRRVLVAFTDGTSTDAVKHYSKALRDDLNVTIIVVAIGDWYDIEQIKSVASDPHSKTLLQTGFDKLGSLTWRLHEMICEAVDHCFSNPCRNNRKCNSFLDHYECDCGTNFSGRNCEEVIDQCNRNNTCTSGKICIGHIGSHDCVCPEGFYGHNCTKVFNSTFDLVFLVDGTREVTDDNFRSSLRFVKNLAKVFNEDITHVALVIYAIESQTAINLTDPFSLADVNKTISSVEYPNQIIRNTGSALSYSKLSVLDTYGRSGVPKVLVVLEGRRSNDGVDEISQVYRTRGFHVFGVGNGNQLAEGQLKEISSRPSSRFYKVVGYDAIDSASFVQHMKEAIATALVPCSSSPCNNNGSCTAEGNSFNCHCQPGYTGMTCEQELSRCVPNPCKNDGQCQASGSSYSCNCQSGFYQLGNCDDDINECDSNPCQNNGQCKNTPGSYYCVCPDGFLGINCGSVCTHQIFNLAFLIDGSSSIKHLNSLSASKYKDLVKTVVDFYHVSPDRTNVAVAVYSSDATIAFKLDKYYSKSSINSTIDGMVFPGKSTRIGSGLAAVRNEIFANARRGIPNILITIADGVSIDDIVLPSAFLKAMKVVMFSVGVGEFYAKEQLDQISSEPDVSYVFEASAIDGLPAIATRLKHAICIVVDHCYSSPCHNGAVCQSLTDGYSCTCKSGFTGRECETVINECPHSSCNNQRRICINFPGASFCNCKPGNFQIQTACNREYTTVFNIGFVLYTGESIDRYHKGNFAKQMAFFSGLSQTFNVSNNSTNIGIITYSGDAAVRFRFVDISNQTDLENSLSSIRINGTGRNIGQALHLAGSDLFNQSNPGRNTVRNILVVVTDDGSDDNIAVPSYKLKRSNVTIFSVGIDRYVRGQLNEMASDPDSDHVFTIDSYDRLGPLMADLKDAIIKAVDPCSTTPCLNLGACFSLSGGSYNCTCAPGWTGVHCELPSTPCTVLPHPCGNHGNCTVSGDGSTSCSCTAGWTGARCENDTNECLQNPCLNDGNCTNTIGSYFCRCPIFTAGANCEMHCDHHNMNIGFLVDASSAVELSGNGNFNKSLAFVANLIQSFSVTRNTTHVGMAVFSNSPHLALDFKDGDISSEAVAAVHNASYLNRGRQTGKALTYVRRYLFSESVMKRNVPNYLVFLTIGTSYDLLKTPSSLLRDNNITVFAVGVGDDYDVKELKHVTGNNGERVYETSFSNLADVGTSLKKEICEMQDQETCSSSPCSNGGLCVNTGNNYRCMCTRGYYGRQCDNGCGFKELGIKAGTTLRTPDNYITSSSQRDANHAAYRGRVGIEVIGSWEDGWCSSQTDTAPYIQVFFEYMTNITMVETEGVADEGKDMWVETYYISTSNSSESEAFINYMEDGQDKMFYANKNAKGVNISIQGTNAHYIRIHPVNFTQPYACMRIALYGCDKGTSVHQGSLLERIDNAPLSKEPVFDTGLAAVPAAVFVGLIISSLMFLMLPMTSSSPISQPKGTKLVDITPSQQQDPNANPAVLMNEVQTITMELGPEEPQASTTEEDANTYSDDVFSRQNMIFGYSSPNA